MPAAPGRPGRLAGVDAARGVALLGMIAVHVLPATESDGVSLAYQLFSGRASALFAVLAGVGLALATGGTRSPRGREWVSVSVGVWARAAVIGAIGLFLGMFPSGVAVILVYYSLLFVLGVFALPLGTRALFALGAVWIVVVPALSQWWRADLPAPSLRVPDPTMLATPVDTLIELALTGYYPVLPWLGYLFIGMAVGRCDLRAYRVQLGLLLGGIGTAVLSWAISSWLLASGGLAEILQAGAGGASLVDGDIETSLQTSLYGTTPTTSWWWLATGGPHSGTPFDLAHTTGTALATIGLMLLIARVGAGAGLLWPLAAAGSMTLTLYSLHVVLLGTFIRGETATVFFVHVAIALGVGILLRALMRRGPLERLAGGAATGARTAVAELTR